MQKRILSSLLLISICGIILSTAVFYIIQTGVAQASADEISLAKLADVKSHIELNHQQLMELSEIVSGENLASARAVSLLIGMEPEILEDTGKLLEIAAALNVDEIDILDETGILRWGTQPFKYGTDFAQTEQTRPFLTILDDPSAEIAPEPLLNASQGIVRQYAGVSLTHTKGVVVVGVIPYRLTDQLQTNNISHVLHDVTIGQTGYMFSISKENGLISSHPDTKLVGTWLSDPLQDHGVLNIGGETVRYHTSDAADQTLVTAFPTSEMYRQRAFSSVFFLIFTITLFSLCSITVHLYIQRYLVRGIFRILGTLDEISSGNLDATADVRSDAEFNRLSDGINHMLFSIKSKIQEVSEAVIAAQEASRAKSSFLANMSHEIRTPMNGIIGMTDLLMGEKLSGHQLQYVRDIKTSAESLLGIINDILDLSKISEGKLMVTPVHIDLNALLHNIVSMMRFTANCKDLKFIADIQTGAPEYIFADDVRLKQILVNLLSNAIKFTKMGYVRLFTKIADGQIIFEITDTGIGIKPEDIPVIFAAFEQVDQRKNRTIKGTGLGLSITKSLVELMNGRIWAESEYGTGTTFHVTIPYVPGDETAIELSEDEFRYIYAPTAQVLLVDDIQTNLTVGAGLLRLCGITADVALSGAEALTLIQEKDYDIVFMDHMMPEMDGIEALALIRAMEGEKYRKLPVIALTANAVNESRDFLLAAGMDDFLSKPVDKGMLTGLLQKWLPAHKIELHEAEEADMTPEAYTEALSAVSLIDGIDVESALNRIGRLQDVLEASIKQLAFSIDGRLQSMQDNLAAGNLSAFAMDAHGFKGSLANIGAARSSELAADLEYAAKEGNKLLCNERFPMFSHVLASLAESLISVFPQSRAKDLPPGDPALLAQKAGEAISCLDNFEAGDALTCLQTLADFTFGAQTDALLRDAENAALAFRYEDAALLLKKVLEESM